MLNVVFVLACSACAFVCGGILGKAWFATRKTEEPDNRESTQTLLEAQRVRYRKRMEALNNVIRRHEETRKQIREKLTEIEAKYEQRGTALKEAQLQQESAQQENDQLLQKIERLESGQHKAANAEKELGMLKIERDELAARLVRMESDLHEQSSTAPAEDEDQLARMREIMGELRESLATSDRRVHDLELQLKASTNRNRDLHDKLQNWKQRVTPLTRQLKQQKALLNKIRDEQRRELPDNINGDDLQAIQGIGPAIEERLKQQGIYHYRQLAELSAEELGEISRKLSVAPNIPVRDAWIEQARQLSGAEEAAESA